MTESIISNERECVVCHTTRNIHRHHIYGGVGRRKNSEKYGCWCYLCDIHHNMDSKEGVHFNKERDLKLKRLCQMIFEETHTRDEFRKAFGRSYLTEEDDDG